MSETRGERNHNPFNLRFNAKIPWMGLVGPDEGGYCVFDSDASGIRAGMRDLYVAWERDGLSTLGELIPHFAPAADQNDVAAYEKDVCGLVGKGVGDPLDLGVPGNLLVVGKAFIHHENGRCKYSEQDLAQAVRRALHNW